MEQIKEPEFSSDYLPSEIPPIYKTDFEKERERSGVFLRQLLTAALLIAALIALNIFFPDIYAVFNSWMTEKFSVPPAGV